MIERGFKLFQPWATHVVRGKLHLLVRSFSTTIRERVAVIATDVSRRIGAVGSVAIVNCIKINEQDVKQQLVDLSGNDYWDYYPKYLIPKNTKNGKVFIWVLRNPREWASPKVVTSKGITWAKTRFDEE
ncbi:MAG: hypothetical protein QW087_08070 [Methanomassiliicoccales archaeon]